MQFSRLPPVAKYFYINYIPGTCNICAEHNLSFGTNKLISKCKCFYKKRYVKNSIRGILKQEHRPFCICAICGKIFSRGITRLENYKLTQHLKEKHLSQTFGVYQRFKAKDEMTGFYSYSRSLCKKRRYQTEFRLLKVIEDMKKKLDTYRDAVFQSSEISQSVEELPKNLNDLQPIFEEKRNLLEQEMDCCEINYNILNPKLDSMSVDLERYMDSCYKILKKKLINLKRFKRRWDKRAHPNEENDTQSCLISQISNLEDEIEKIRAIKKLTDRIKFDAMREYKQSGSYEKCKKRNSEFEMKKSVWSDNQRTKRRKKKNKRKNKK